MEEWLRNVKPGLERFADKLAEECYTTPDDFKDLDGDSEIHAIIELCDGIKPPLRRALKAALEDLQATGSFLQSSIQHADSFASEGGDEGSVQVKGESYSKKKLLGKGNAEIWLVENTHLGSTRVLKIETPATIKKEWEARKTLGVHIGGTWEAHGKHFLKAFNYQEGYLILESAEQSLRDRLKGGQIIGLQILSVVDNIITGLSHMHEAKLCHMDLKPGNIFQVKDANGDQKVRRSSRSSQFRPMVPPVSCPVSLPSSCVVRTSRTPRKASKGSKPPASSSLLTHRLVESRKPYVY